MIMAIELTEQQRQAIEAQQGRPVEVVDPATNRVYVLVASEIYEQVRAVLEQPPATAADLRARIVPLMLRSQQAFWRELAELLTLRSKKRQWVGYHGDERIGFGATQTELYQECFRRGLQRGEFYVGKIAEDETPPWGTLQSDWSLYEVTDGGEKAAPPDAV